MAAGAVRSAMSRAGRPALRRDTTNTVVTQITGIRLKATFYRGYLSPAATAAYANFGVPIVVNKPNQSLLTRGLVPLSSQV